MRKPRGYWNNYERCKEEALKYKNKTEFDNKCVSALKSIRRNGWIELLDHMYIRKSNGYWTYERCKEVTLKYDTWSTLLNDNPYLVVLIKKNKWDGLLSHITKFKRDNGYWTYERCKEEALKYDKKNIFKKEQSSAYNNIYRNEWLELCNHMEIQGNKYKRIIYAFEFSDKSCYVGLTGNIKRRKSQHLLKDPNSSVFKYMLETNLTPILVLKSDYIDVEDAIKMENTILNDYKNKNWKILNKTKTGGIGSPNIKWNKESCKIEALKYTKVSEYQNGSKSSYHASLKNGWIDDVCSHMNRCKSKNGYWNDKELCRKEALKYNSISEFHRNCGSAYNYSKINGWLDEFYVVRPESKNGYWNDKELCRREALKYKNKSEFRKNFSSAYNYSRINSWLCEFFI